MKTIKPTIIQAIQSLVPQAEFAIVGGVYSGIMWHDDRTQPTEAEVTAELARLEAVWEATEYQRKREVEYPDIGDQLDAILKGGQALKDMKDTVAAVKAKYPKP